MARIDWFDDKTDVPVVDEQVHNLETFVDAMADGIIEKGFAVQTTFFCRA